MVILKSAAVAGLPLNLEVKVKKVLLVYFERHARPFTLCSAKLLKVIHFKMLVKQATEPSFIVILFYLIFFL